MSFIGISCDPICEHGFYTARERCIHCELQKQITALTDTYKSLSIQAAAHHEHKLRQIDENRKVSRRVDEHEEGLIIHKNKLIDLDKRIYELEKAYKADYEVAKDIIFQGAQTHASILKCEKGLKDLEQLFYDEKDKFRCNDKKPHTCPVCGGSGCGKEIYNISVDGVNMGTKNHPCHSCDGKGIVWG